MTAIWSALRYAIFVAGLGLAWGAFSVMAANNVRLTNPRLAYQYDPIDSQALAAELNRRLLEEKRFVLDDRDMVNVKAALARNPLNRAVLRGLASHYEASGDAKRALPGMLLSSAVSKRDSIAQLWLGEYYLRQGNMPSALKHYDYSMSTKPATREVIFPRVLDKLGERRDLPRELFLPFGNRPWFEPFVSALVARNPQLAFRLMTGGQIDVRHAGLDATAVELAYSLVRSGDLDAGLGLFRRVRPKFETAQLGDPAVSAKTADPKIGPFAWTFPDGAVLADYSEQGVLQLTGQVAGRELIASRDILIPGPGNYRLQFEQADQSDASTKLFWGFQCIGAELVSDLQADPLPAVADGSTKSVAVDVSSECRMLRLMLYLDGDGSGAVFETQLAGLRLSH